MKKGEIVHGQEFIDQETFLKAFYERMNVDGGGNGQILDTPVQMPYEPPVNIHHTPTEKKQYEPPVKSHYEPPAKSHYEPPAKSHYEPPTKSHYELPVKSHVPRPKSHYAVATEPVKSSSHGLYFSRRTGGVLNPRPVEHVPSKSHYEELPAIFPPEDLPTAPSKSEISTINAGYAQLYGSQIPGNVHYSYVPYISPRYLYPWYRIPQQHQKSSGKTSYEPPVKSNYEPPVKSHFESPVKSHYDPPVKSHYEPPVKSHYEPPVKSNYEPPAKSHYEPPIKSHYEPPVKSQNYQFTSEGQKSVLSKSQKSEPSKSQISSTDGPLYLPPVVR